MAHCLGEGRLALLFMNDTKQQEEALFDAARRLADPAQRKTFLDLGCGAKVEMRNRIVSFLKRANNVSESR